MNLLLNFSHLSCVIQDWLQVLQKLNPLFSLIIVFLLGVTAIASLISAWQSRGAVVAAEKSAKATQKASVGQMMIQLTSQYGSKEMYHSMKNLREWQQKINSKGGNPPEILAQKLRKDNPNAIEVNLAKRTCFTYFDTLRILYDRQVIKKKDINELLDDYAITLLLEIIEPIEYEIAKIEDRDYGHKTFEFFRNWKSKLDKKYPRPLQYENTP